MSNRTRSSLVVEDDTAMQATHIYCDVCEAIQPAEFEPLTFEDTTGRYLGGDAVCTVCGNIVATLYRPKQGAQVT